VSFGALHRRGQHAAAIAKGSTPQGVPPFHIHIHFRSTDRKASAGLSVGGKTDGPGRKTSSCRNRLEAAIRVYVVRRYRLRTAAKHVHARAGGGNGQIDGRRTGGRLRSSCTEQFNLARASNAVTADRAASCVGGVGILASRRDGYPTRCRLRSRHRGTHHEGLRKRQIQESVGRQRAGIRRAAKGFGYQNIVAPVESENRSRCPCRLRSVHRPHRRARWC
jgi:hypothetical protein